MSDRAMLSPWASVRAEELTQLIARGKAQGELTLDEVMLVFKGVELDEDVIERVRGFLRAEGITLDESVDVPDGLDDEIVAVLADDRRATTAMVTGTVTAVVDPDDADEDAAAIVAALTPVPDAEADAASKAATDAAIDERATSRKRVRSQDTRDPLRMGANQGGGSSDPVRMYLKEIGRVALLTGDEEVALAKRIETGAVAAEELADLAASGRLTDLDPVERRRLERRVNDGDRAKAELTQANLRLVVSIAKRYVGRGML